MDQTQLMKQANRTVIRIMMKLQKIISGGFWPVRSPQPVVADVWIDQYRAYSYQIYHWGKLVMISMQFTACELVSHSCPSWQYPQSITKNTHPTSVVSSHTITTILNNRQLTSKPFPKLKFLKIDSSISIRVGSRRQIPRRIQQSEQRPAAMQTVTQIVLSRSTQN